MKKNSIKKQNGITLITLVTTIIIILILAGITINMAIGDGGVIKQGEETIDAEMVAQDKQKIEAAIYSYNPYSESNSSIIEYLRDLSWVEDIRKGENECIIKLDNGNEYDIYDLLKNEWETTDEINLNDFELDNNS